MSLSNLNINKQWTVFLDRDGVLNKRIVDGYVTKLEELEVLEGVPEAVNIFNQIFNRVLVVTNQQGVGKGLMSENDLFQIHWQLNQRILETGEGGLEKFYFAPHLVSENSPRRKPGIGMALEAKEDFPEIEFAKSLMVGDSKSDMEFGRNAGMKNILIGDLEIDKSLYDYQYKRLIDFANALNQA